MERLHPWFQITKLKMINASGLRNELFVHLQVKKYKNVIKLSERNGYLGQDQRWIETAAHVPKHFQKHWSWNCARQASGLKRPADLINQNLTACRKAKCEVPGKAGGTDWPTSQTSTGRVSHDVGWPRSVGNRKPENNPNCPFRKSPFVCSQYLYSRKILLVRH